MLNEGRRDITLSGTAILLLLLLHVLKITYVHHKLCGNMKTCLCIPTPESLHVERMKTNIIMHNYKKCTYKHTHIYMYLYHKTASRVSDILAVFIGLSQTRVYRAKHPPESLNFYQIHVIISCKGYYNYTVVIHILSVLVILYSGYFSGWGEVGAIFF